jgi:hypothetical protein
MDLPHLSRYFICRTLHTGTKSQRGQNGWAPTLEHALQNFWTNKPQQTHQAMTAMVHDSSVSACFNFQPKRCEHRIADEYPFEQNTGATSQPDLSMETAGITSTVLDVGAGRMESRLTSGARFLSSDHPPEFSSRISTSRSNMDISLGYNWDILLEYIIGISWEYHWILDNWDISRI